MTKKELKRCEKLVADKLNVPIFNISKISGGGSSRQYYRIIAEGEEYVFCFSENIKENETFIRLTEYLEKSSINVPHILAVTEEKDGYLLQDLGDEDLLGVIHGSTSWEELYVILSKVLDQLVSFQTLPEAEWKDLVEFSQFDEKLIENDFMYAVENFLDRLNAKYDERKLMEDFERLGAKLLDYPQENWGLMYRDFQSRNIMIPNAGKAPYLIDYQSARKGPGIYDLVSFAWQAKAGFTQLDRVRLIELYIRKLEEKGKNVKNIVKENVDYFVIFRILQTLGAYGKRGLIEGKKHFIESIPAALENLSEVLSKPAIKAEFPQLSRLICSVSFSI